MNCSLRLLKLLLLVVLPFEGLFLCGWPVLTAAGVGGTLTHGMHGTRMEPTVVVPTASPSGEQTTIDQTKMDAYTRYEPEFRRDYESKYAKSGYAYDQYRPAYRYGYDLGTTPAYHDRDWNAMEQQAHRGWDEGTMGVWEQYKEAVRYGWERGRRE